jgi:hypothetical protein
VMQRMVFLLVIAAFNRPYGGQCVFAIWTLAQVGIIS